MQPDRPKNAAGRASARRRKRSRAFSNRPASTSVEQCEKRDDRQGRILFRGDQAPRPAGQATCCPSCCARRSTLCPGPNRCACRRRRFRWVRPLLGICRCSTARWCRSISATCRSAASPRATAFCRPAKSRRVDFDDYRAKLKTAKVVLDADERRKLIAAIAGQGGGLGQAQTQARRALLDEVAGLVEWPVVLIGRIDPSFMDLPPEVLQSRCARTRNISPASTPTGSAGAALSPSSPTWSAEDGGTAIVAGNERVLRARLADARFFWDQDRKVTLAERVPKLARAGVPRQARQRATTRSARVAKLAEALRRACAAPTRRTGASARPSLPRPICRPAWSANSPSCKASWAATTRCTTARRREVADAIADHYAPLGPNDALPDRAGQRRGGAGRQARYAGRVLRHRREADRLGGSLRAAPRRARHHPHHSRKQAAPAAAPRSFAGTACTIGTARHDAATRDAARLPRRPPARFTCRERRARGTT